MNRKVRKENINLVLFMGIIGCLLMGGSDWLMIYGDTTFEGSIAWLTLGVSEIKPWRNSLAMALSFPAVICYSLALYGISSFISDNKHKHIYSYLTAVGLTPWLCLHLLYVMILFAFQFMYSQNQEFAYFVCEAMFNQFSWIVIVGEIIMLLPFAYLFYVFVSGKSKFKKIMAINNPLLIYVLLKLATMLMPDCAFRLAFTNGLMSESMLLWFLMFLIVLNTGERSDNL